MLVESSRDMIFPKYVCMWEKLDFEKLLTACLPEVGAIALSKAFVAVAVVGVNVLAVCCKEEFRLILYNV